MPSVTTDILRRKFDRCFAVLDTDEDGVLTEGDYLESGQRLATAFGLGSGTAQAQTLQRQYLSMWRDIQGIDAGAEGVSTDEFAASIREAQAADMAAYLTQLNALTDAFVTICDTDHDGKVGPAEYEKMFVTAFAMTPAEAQASFQHLDADGSGVLSHEELRSAVGQFFTSTDSLAPGNWLFGAWE